MIFTKCYCSILRRHVAQSSAVISNCKHSVDVGAATNGTISAEQKVVLRHIPVVAQSPVWRVSSDSEFGVLDVWARGLGFFLFVVTFVLFETAC